ncbi:MAG: rhodanese-like domain-containing protein [Gemmatimonadota bacterium]
MQQPNRFASLVQEAKARIKEASVDEIKARLDRGERFYLIDVREESEWGRGHVPSAGWLSRGILETQIERAIPDAESDIVLYCGGGSRSALAAESLQRMGYTNVTSMDGGFGGWVRAGYPIER